MNDTTTSVAAQVAALSSLPTADLWALWDRFFKRRPDNPNRNYLDSRVAYKLQEQALGGPPAETQRRLINIGMRHSKIKSRQIDRDIELAPGTVLPANAPRAGFRWWTTTTIPGFLEATPSGPDSSA